MFKTVLFKDTVLSVNKKYRTIRILVVPEADDGAKRAHGIKYF
jgi:hypothetical protein